MFSERGIFWILEFREWKVVHSNRKTLIDNDQTLPALFKTTDNFNYLSILLYNGKYSMTSAHFLLIAITCYFETAQFWEKTK